ncbi:hypothetical protein MHTCC0001_20110 [Flavobacteriaceae bacterium MHTCC 0001]
MKNHYLILCFITAAFAINAQTTNCDDANYYVLSAYSHVKTSYDANNISHLKYYAHRSLESYKLSEPALPNCNCDSATELSVKVMDLLAKVDGAETFEDGRFFVKRAREIAQKIVAELDDCTVPTSDDEVASVDTSGLSELERKQNELLRQQEALKQEAEALKAKIAEEEKAANQLAIDRKNLISSYNQIIPSTVENYNNTLKKCGCDKETIVYKNDNMDFSNKSLKSVKSHYLTTLETLTSEYLEQLKNCNTK